MKTGARIAVVVLALGGAAIGWGFWAHTYAAPRQVASAWDGLEEAVSGRDPLTRCYYNEEASDGRNTVRMIPAQACYSLDPPRRYTGFYTDEVELQLLVSGVKPARRAGEPAGRLWLNFDSVRDRGPLGQARDDGGSRQWYVDLVGREAYRPGHYGPMGEIRRMIVVDRVIAANLVPSLDDYQAHYTHRRR